MSNESENKKDLSVEVSDASGDKVEDDANTSEDSQDTVNAQTDKNEEKDSVNDSKESEDSKLDEETPAEPEEKIDNKENDENEDDKDAKNKKPEKGTKKESKNSKSEDETENGEAEEEEEEEPVKVKADAPVKKAGKKGATLPNKTRETPETQKKVNKAKVAEVADTKEDKAVAIEGKGAQLGEIPRVDASISRFKNDDLKLLYRLLFKTPGKTALIAKSIKKFNGFGFKKESEDYTKKLDSTKKFELKQLKSICEMLDLDKKGTKDEIAERILDFLIEPKDSGKQTDGGRPKRTAAVRANNRGYSSHDDSYSSDERRASRGRRGKGKRVNLKDDTTSESDEEFHLSDTSEPKARSVKRKKTAPKPVSDEENISDADDPSSDESDVDGKKRKTKKVANNKPNPPKPTPGRRGRKPAAETEKKPATPKKPVGRKRALSEESDAAPDENGSSSEDEPLIKKAKSPQPPTDEEIKKYVKEILEGANLEEITMKTVCKQVYAHYPDFDLAHKKDFIKATVKSLIST